MPALVELLQWTLAEEENADQLLNQVARPLMSAARMPLAVESLDNGRVAAPNNRK
jgi:Mn-containing catalase